MLRLQLTVLDAPARWCPQVTTDLAGSNWSHGSSRYPWVDKPGNVKLSIYSAGFAGFMHGDFPAGAHLPQSNIYIFISIFNPYINMFELLKPTIVTIKMVLTQYN